MNITTKQIKAEQLKVGDVFLQTMRASKGAAIPEGTLFESLETVKQVAVDKDWLDEDAEEDIVYVLCESGIETTFALDEMVELVTYYDGDKRWFVKETPAA
jgi:hypothetical protein